MNGMPEGITPVKLAIPVADRLMESGRIDKFERADGVEERELAMLDSMAELAGFLKKQYFVNSHRSIAVPVSFDADKDVSLYNFNEGLDFSGMLVTYATVRIGRSLGGSAMRALCMAFDDVTLLPYFDKLPTDQLLYTPVYAVEDMSGIGSMS